MRMPSLSVLTVAATALMGTAAANAGILPAGGGVINTTETSYESLVLAPNDVLNGIFNVSQITAASGITYTYGAGNYYLVGSFTGFTLNSSSAIPGGTRLYFTGGALNYYSFGADPFAGGALTSGTPANQAASLATIASGTLELALVPEVIYNGPGGQCPVVGCTLYIDVFGGLNSFAAASTSTAYLDIVGGNLANAFVKDSLLNTFTAALADGQYQGSANSTQCQISPQWQVCGTNHATFSVIPEPITVSLFGAGLAGAAALRRRKAKKA